jgi:hypothetical protein
MYGRIVLNIMTTKKEATQATESKIKQPKLKLKNVEVVFANLEDEGFGRSLTIKVTGENETMINKFFKVNQIGNEKSKVIGEPNYKEYEGTKQLGIRINDNTKFAGLNGLDKIDLGFGARIDCIVNAFEYNNKFTRGATFVGTSISAVVILSGRRTGADADLNDLLNEAQEREFVQGDEFVQKEVAQAESAKDDLPF